MAPNRTQLARDVFTYLHVLVVAGIIVSAIGDELVIKHPHEALPPNELLALVAGPVIFLLAMTAIRLRASGSWSVKRPLAAAAIALIGAVGQDADALVLATLIVVVLAILIGAEEWSHRRRFGSAAPEEEIGVDRL
jgi:low temperature requirement protein LtrA